MLYYYGLSNSWVAAISFAIETYCGGGGAGITDQSGGILLTDATVYSGAAALHHAQHQGGWVGWTGCG